MDVAIVAAARFPIREPFAGGMEAHTHALAERLWARGHDVTVYAAGGDGPYGVHAMLPVDFEASPAARRDVSSGPAAAVAEHHSYLDAVLEVGRRRHQIVHINAVHHLPFACAGLWTTSVVTATLHTPPTPWLESALTLAAARRDLPSMVSVSHANARAWRGVPIDRVIHNGVDLERWRLGAGGSGAVWWGRLVPEKAPHLAIDAARLAGMPITLMGPLHDDDYFAREVQPRLGDGARYAGHLTTREVAAAVGRAAVAVVTPAWDEPFGLVVAEALACGTPVAAFDRGAMGELITDATGRLAPPGDVDRLATAMLDAASGDRLACRREAEVRFSSDAMAGGYESWFQTLLAARSGDAR
ncbi:MAG TPA: glycosyltransferase [Ilumatobacteraceae bacterium]|nr:glycosyltransferase [Ilumatobacteraceae bacterium]